MNVNAISQNIDNRYKELSAKKKVWLLIATIIIILLSLSSIGVAIYAFYTRNQAIAKYEHELEKSKQNYYLQTISNNNLEKKLQDMSLKLAETINNTIELERMFHELSEEKVSLEEIRAQMESGIHRTKNQLDKMQNSVNSLINQRTKVIINTEEEIIYEKSNTHGKY